MSLESLPGGTVVATGEHVHLVQLLALRGALHLETLGMKRRGRQASAIARELLKLRPRAPLAQVLRTLEDHIEATFGPLSQRYTAKES